MFKINERIHRLRRERKLSQEALGALVGVSHPTIGNWEKGNTEPSLADGYSLAIALNTTVKYLVTGEEESARVLDGDLLSQSIRDVEEAATALKRDISPELKATLITARYNMGESPSLSEILGIFE